MRASSKSCLGCGTEFASRSWNHVRCRDCQRERERERDRRRSKDPKRRAYGNALRRKLRSDPAFRESENASARERDRERYASDPAYRERRLETNRKSYRESEEVRERRKARQKERYASKLRDDPAYMKSNRARSKAWYEAHKGTEQYRAKVRERQRKRWLRIGGSKPRRFLKLLCVAQNWKCGICGRTMIRNRLSGLHVDHILPVSKGGGSELSNLRATHAACNQSRSNRDNDIAFQRCLDLGE